MSNNCKNCGGQLYFNIADQKLHCRSCSSVSDPAEFVSSTDARELEVNVFTCPNCGGEIIAEEVDAIDYCSFCGSFVSLSSHIQKIQKPEYILPFSINKDDCRKAFKRNIGFSPFTPKEFKNDKFLQSFRNIYIPYWLYEVELDPKLGISAHRSKRRGDYIYKQNYYLKADLDASVSNLAYDASSFFDDGICEKIAPFDVSEAKDFNVSYMFGAYGDGADVKAELYQADAVNTTLGLVNKKVKREKEFRRYQFSPLSPMSAYQKEDGPKLAMLPVWFLTWRKKNRVAYSVVNGQSGSIFSEIPTSIPKFLLFSLILAIPLYFLFNMFLTLTAPQMVVVATILSYLTIYLYMANLTRIARKEIRADDRGYLSVEEENKEKVEELEKAGLISSLKDKLHSKFPGMPSIVGYFFVTYFMMILFYCLTFVGIAAFSVFSVPFYLYLYIIADVLCLLVYYRMFKTAKLIAYKGIVIDLLGSLLAILLAHLLCVFSPANDMYYYLTSIIALIGVIVSLIQIINKNNLLITRPLPRFFDKLEEEDD